MTITETRGPSPAAAGDDGDGSAPVQHSVCCDDDIAMCGQDVSGAGWAPEGEGIPCPLCRLAVDAGLPCPIPECSGSPITG